MEQQDEILLQQLDDLIAEKRDVGKSEGAMDIFITKVKEVEEEFLNEREKHLKTYHNLNHDDFKKEMEVKIKSLHDQSDSVESELKVLIGHLNKTKADVCNLKEEEARIIERLQALVNEANKSTTELLCVRDTLNILIDTYEKLLGIKLKSTSRADKLKIEMDTNVKHCDCFLNFPEEYEIPLGDEDSKSITEVRKAICQKWRDCQCQGMDF